MPLVTLPAGVTMTPALLKQIMDTCGTCNPCGSGSGFDSGSNPGCCTSFSGCATCYRQDISWTLANCSMFTGCTTGTGFVQDTSGCGGSSTQSQTVTDAQNYTTSDVCSLQGDSPGVCAGAWIASGNIQVLCYSSNFDPATDGPIDKTLDAWRVLVGFTCFTDSNGVCPSRYLFCANAVFFEGITPAPAINPQYRAYFRQEAESFTFADCDPFIFEVTNLSPYQVDEAAGLDGGGGSIPLTKTCSGNPRISASWTGSCQ